jgi:hypothetical protein
MVEAFVHMLNRCIRMLSAAVLMATLWDVQTVIANSDHPGSAATKRTSDTPEASPVAAVIFPPSFTPAPHRNPPQVPNHDAAGNNCPPRNDCASPKALRIVSIIPKTFPHANELQKFGQSIGKSKWLERFTAAFGIPGPAIMQVIMVDDMPDLNQGQKTVSDYQNYVFAKAITSGLTRAPQHQTIYVLYIPCDPDHKPSPGMDTFGCTSHHPSIQAIVPEQGLFQPGDSMALSLGFHPRTNAGSFTANNATVAVTHELAEAATDTKPLLRFNLFTGDPNYLYENSGSNANGTPWVRELVGSEGVMELADMAAGHRWYEAGPDGSGPFEYARVYNNEASKAGGDPAVPAGIHPYYNVSTNEDWVTAPASHVAVVSFTAWSAEDIGSWDVEGEIAHWEADDNAPAAAPVCSLPTKHWTVHNGSKVDVVVNTTPVLGGTNWCVVGFKNTKNFTDGDDYHMWWAGVILKVPPRTPDDACVCADGFKAGPDAHAGTEACAHICRAHERRYP